MISDESLQVVLDGVWGHAILATTGDRNDALYSHYKEVTLSRASAAIHELGGDTP